ncbi:MAG: AgmX/PglI C-terminal domain-containing protein [Spongiibacteraceae bacterium]
MSVIRVPNPQLPWSSSRDEDSSFRKILIALLVIYIVIALMVALLKLPPVVHPEPKDLPPQLANVVLQKVELPKPVETPKPIEKVVEKEKPVEKPKVEQPKPKPVPPTTQPVPPSKTGARAAGPEGGKEAPIDLTQQAREKAAKSGILQFKDDLADMRESVDVSQVKRSNLTRGTGTAEKTERSIIAGKASGGSGGINTAALSTDTGGVALSGRETTRIDSPGGLGGLSTEAGGRGRGEGSGIGTGTGKGTGKKGDLVSGSDVGGGRSDESIRRVMDAQKGAIFGVYNRALRQDPTLQGKFVFEMVIEPSGEVSAVKVISSELNDSDLISKILARIRLINFGAADVLRTRVNYSLDFLPNA